MNTLQATIQTITSSKELTCLNVQIEDISLHLLLAQPSSFRTGEAVTLAFKETEVILAKTPFASSANSIPATILLIQEGVVLTSVTLECCSHTVCALVATATFKAMECTLGQQIYWLINPSEISLLKGHHER